MTAYQQNAVAQAQDWRQGLLRGHRSVTVKRGGLSPENIVYMNGDGSINYSGFTRLCWLMRDVRAEKVVSMDINLFDIICGLQRWAHFNGVESVVVITSGYRCENTNSTTEGAAKNSLHLKGRALDFVMQGIGSRSLGAMVRTFNGHGGTGIYIGKGFVHADTGPSRVWVG